MCLWPRDKNSGKKAQAAFMALYKLRPASLFCIVSGRFITGCRS